MFTLSAAGRSLAFVANTSGPNQVWVRAMDTLEARPLAGTDGATYPFWSPDGAYLGFFAQGKLKKIAIAGGPALTLCDATSGRGGTWNRDGVIVFSAAPTSPLLRVSAAGGVPVSVTTLAGGSSGSGHRFPVFLPDGVHYLYTVGPEKPEVAGLHLGSLDGVASERLLPDGTNALCAPAGAIRELAGHADLPTTRRYMHLSSAATEDAIRLLDGPSPTPRSRITWRHRGDAIGEVWK